MRGFALLALINAITGYLNLSFFLQGGEANHLLVGLFCVFCSALSAYKALSS
jgi:hypothetical protein